jgi:hypothetical protein
MARPTQWRGLVRTALSVDPAWNGWFGLLAGDVDPGVQALYDAVGDGTCASGLARLGGEEVRYLDGCLARRSVAVA